MVAKVSVILPSLNVAAYIRECLDSVMNQSLQELEIICIDAGSTDGTADILEEYADRDSRIILLHSKIKSYGRQVNMGLDHAGGKYVAILETDDWIEKDMYQCLYTKAEEDRLDYVAADFDTFIRLQNGCNYFTRQHIFSDVAWRDMGQEESDIFPTPVHDWYGQVLGPDRIAVLRSTDYVLWKGIYNREFLNQNGIRLHESPGAAFQDMGFLQQVKSYAKRAAYIDKSFYRYRQGREEASSGCAEGLRYYEGEFRWLNEQQNFIGSLKGAPRNYYYFTMSIAFLTKYEQILSNFHGEWKDDRLEEPCEWFQRQISDAVDEGLLKESMYGRETWERLRLLLVSREAYARRFADRENAMKKAVQDCLCMIANRPVVIFGCGIRGERLMLFCDRNQIRMDAFCDNKEELHGKKKFGIPVISPMELAQMAGDRNQVVLLSMKEGRDQVRNQLIALGIEDSRVIEKLPAGIV